MGLEQYNMNQSILGEDSIFVPWRVGTYNNTDVKKVSFEIYVTFAH